MQTYLDSGVKNFYNALGASPTLNSGYRNPQQEINVAKPGKAYPNSRHMAGDAADFPIGGTAQQQQQTWTTWARVAIALKPRPCREPAFNSKGVPVQGTYDHLHIDWRVQYGTAGTFKSSFTSCPPDW